MSSISSCGLSSPCLPFDILQTVLQLNQGGHSILKYILSIHPPALSSFALQPFFPFYSLADLIFDVCLNSPSSVPDTPTSPSQSFTTTHRPVRLQSAEDRLPALPTYHVQYLHSKSKMPPHQIITINTIFAPPFSSFALRWLAGFSDRISNLPLHQKSSHRQSLQTPPTSQQPTPFRMRHALCARRLVPGAKKMEDFRLQALCWAPLHCRVLSSPSPVLGTTGKTHLGPPT